MQGAYRPKTMKVIFHDFPGLFNGVDIEQVRLTSIILQNA